MWICCSLVPRPSPDLSMLGEGLGARLDMLAYRLYRPNHHSTYTLSSLATVRYVVHGVVSIRLVTISVASWLAAPPAPLKTGGCFKTCSTGLSCRKKTILSHAGSHFSYRSVSRNYGSKPTDTQRWSPRERFVYVAIIPCQSVYHYYDYYSRPWKTMRCQSYTFAT